ncbi:MAG: alpha-galactosidase [Candidatus Thorarchaeota archaeon]
MNLDTESCKVEIGENAIHLTNGIVTISYDTRMGELSLRSLKDKKTSFSRAYALVHTDRQVYDSRKMIYKSFSALDFEEEEVKGKAIILKLQDVEKSAELSMKVSVFQAIPGFSMVVQFRNRSEELRIKSVDTLVIDVEDSSRIATGWNGKNIRLFKNGFHSWELSQAKAIEEGENLSHMFSVLNNIDTKESLVIGFTSLSEQFSTVSVHGRKEEKSRLASIAASVQTDDIPVTEKDSLVSEEMIVLWGNNALENLSLYMDMIALRMDAKKWKNTPVGWCSWYFYYTMPDEAEIIENTDYLKNRYNGQIAWIQIDDGYQKRVGDWEENSRFSSGLENLVKEIRKREFRAGIWTAPFVASEHSDLFKDKRDWFVKDKEGNPIIVGENPLWLGNYYALDLTNPSVIKHIKKTFKKLKDQGFEYFKIDFLYHATCQGNRYDNNMTTAQAIRQGLVAIRDIVGEDLVLGCGAPLGVCVGLVDMMRIGTDIGTNWRYDWGGGVYECSVNTMTRAVMHDRLWINDPDCILVRQDDNDLTEDEVKLWLTIVSLSGGAVLMSDRMMEVSEERLALVDKLLPPYGKSAKAIDSLENMNPSIFGLPISSENGKSAVVAAINLNENPIDVTIKMEDLGLDREVPHHVFDFWAQEYHGLSEDSVSILNLRPHSCRLFAIKPEAKTPTILSTSIHVTQGLVELGDLDWNSGGNELSMRLTKSTKSDEAIFIVFGNEWIPSRAYVNDELVQFEQVAAEVVAVRHKYKIGDTVRVKFTQ